MKTIALLTVLALAACSQMEDFYPGASVVTIDGHEHLVRKLSGRASTYQAMENNPTVGQMMTGIDASIYARNVKAIEQVTGCKVALGSVENGSNITMAATDC